MTPAGRVINCTSSRSAAHEPFTIVFPLAGALEPLGRPRKEDAAAERKAIEAKELISFGLIPEFIGRIPVIAELNKLSKEDLIRVLKEPKNAIIKQYEILFELDGVELEFTYDALERIAEIAVEKDVVARGLI